MAEFEESYLLPAVQIEGNDLNIESLGARVKRSPEPKNYGKNCKEKPRPGCEQCVGCHICCNGKTCIKKGGGCHPAKGKGKKKMKKH